MRVELRHEEGTISAEQQAFPAAGLRLPYEVILEIFSFLRAADLLKASSVCNQLPLPPKSRTQPHGV